MDVGTHLGKFEIVGLLGKGGMGEVYRATDSKLGRDVAIKVLPKSFAADEERLARFEREAQTLASLNHPNVATVHGFEHDAEKGVHFLVMEHIDGETLGQRIESGALSVSEVLPLFIDIARGLDAAHEAGIVHRDMKPDNVKINQDGVVKILDFGIAKSTGVSNDTDPDAATTPMSPVALTAEGTFMGTPVYMSPEQARGKAVDKRTDIWAFGCCLYEALTGKLPFVGDTVADTVGSILKIDPDWSNIPQDAPPEIRSLLRRCLEKDSRKRFSSAGDMAYVLQEYKDRSESLAHQPKQTEPTLHSAAPARSWAPTLVGMGLAFVGIITGIFMSRDTQSINPATSDATPTITSIAVLPLGNLMDDSEQDYFVDGMTEAITGELSKISSLKVISRTSTIRYKDTEMTMPEIAAELGVQGIIEGTVMRENAEVSINVRLYHGPSEQQLWTENYTKPVTSVLKLHAEVALAIAGEIRATVKPDEERRIAGKGEVNTQALEAYLRGRQLMASRSKEDMNQAIVEFERAIAIDGSFAVAHAGIAKALNLLGIYRFIPPAEALRRSEDVARKAIALDPTLPEAYSSLGWTLVWGNGNWTEAEQSIEKSLALDPNFADGLLRYGTILMLTGRNYEARLAIERAIEIDPNFPINLQMSPFLSMYEGDVDRALQEYEDLLDRVPDFLPGLQNKITALALADRNEEALEAAEKFVGRRNNDSYSTDLAAGILVRLGRLEDAKSRIENHPDYETYSWIEYFNELGDVDQVLAGLRRDMETGLGFPLFAADPRYAQLRDDDRYWEFIEEIGYPSMPSGHPVFEQQEAYRIKMAAQKLLDEQGLSVSAGIKSLAVLPLENRMNDAEQDFFVDGMTEAITAELSQISSLKVISRTSAMHYKNSTMTAPEIAKELGVAGLIEGSVMRQGNNVNIRVSLLDGSSDEQLWTETYDGTLDNIFQLNSDIALAITDEIRAEISPDERRRVSKPISVSVDAYETWLQAREYMREQSNSGYDNAIELINEVIRLEPDFADAHAGLAAAYFHAQLRGLLPGEENVKRAETAKARALELDPESAYANMVAARSGTLKISEAQAFLHRAVELDPNDFEPHRLLAHSYAAVGQLQQGLREAKLAIESDPQNILARDTLADVYSMVGDWENAVIIRLDNLEQFPGHPGTILDLTNDYIALGQYDKVEGLLTPSIIKDLGLSHLPALLLALRGETDASRLAFEQLMSGPSSASITPVGRMVLHANLGETDKALEWMNVGVGGRSGSAVYFASALMTVGELDDDPRFWEIIEDAGLTLQPGAARYEKQQAYRINKAAQEMLAEQGLAASDAIESIAVLPFRNLSLKSEEDYFAESMTEAITAELGKIKALNIRGRTSAMQYKDTVLEIPAIAEALNVDALIEGSVQREGDEVKITVTLQHGVNDIQLWSDSYTETITSVLKLQSDVALDIAEAVNTEITGEERERMTDAPDVDPKALEAYLLGQQLYVQQTEASLKSALREFRRATELDESFTVAFVGLATTYLNLTQYNFLPSRLAGPEVLLNARKAIELDDTSAIAHSILANGLWTFEKKWPEADAEFRRALGLDPSNGVIRIDYSTALGLAGQSGEARRQMALALEFDSSSTYMRLWSAWTHFTIGDFDDAISIFGDLSKEDDTLETALEGLAESYHSKGDYRQALALIKQLAQLRGNDPFARIRLGIAYATTGEIAKAQAILEAESKIVKAIMEDDSAEAQSTPLPFVNLADLYSWLGDYDTAIKWLHVARENMTSEMAIVTAGFINPKLRDDPRFWELLEDMNFPKVSQGHLAYEQQENYRIQKAAKEMLAEQGLDGAPVITSLAVLPFENVSGDMEKDYFVDGMTGALTSELSKISSIKVIGRASAMHYKDTDKSPREIAEELGVDGLITGSALQLENEVRITAELVHAATQTTLWSEDYDNTLENVLKLHSEVALDISSAISATLSESEKSSYASTKGVIPAAYDLYLQARALMGFRTEEALGSAIDLFERVVAIDPDFAPAYAGLADCHALNASYDYTTVDEARGPVEAYAAKAIALDNNSSEAHLSLAESLKKFTTRWGDMESEYRRAIELNPNSAQANAWYGEFLAYSGRHSEALDAAQRAVELDPASAQFHTALGNVYYLVRDFDLAAKLFDEAMVLDSVHPWALDVRSLVHMFEGEYDEAIKLVENLYRLEHQIELRDHRIALIKAFAGEPEAARAFLEARDEDSDDENHWRVMEILLLHAALGDVDAAMECLDRAISFTSIELRINPLLEPLRDDPRFWAFIDTLDLPPLPPGHPLYAKEQAWKINERAEELIAERGLVPGPSR